MELRPSEVRGLEPVVRLGPFVLVCGFDRSKENSLSSLQPGVARPLAVEALAGAVGVGPGLLGTNRRSRSFFLNIIPRP